MKDPDLIDAIRDAKKSIKKWTKFLRDNEDYMRPEERATIRRIIGLDGEFIGMMKDK